MVAREAPHLNRFAGVDGRDMIFTLLRLLFLSSYELELQGLGSTLTIRRLKKIHKSIAPDIMFLMENKNGDEYIKKET